MTNAKMEGLAQAANQSARATDEIGSTARQVNSVAEVLLSETQNLQHEVEHFLSEVRSVA